jgi:hypothetical protein
MRKLVRENLLRGGDMSSLRGTQRRKADTWIRRHRLIFYFALTYAISWPL